MEVTIEMRNKLREPLPPEAISPHPTKKYLSSIKAIYVVERLNDVFGIGSWTLKSDMIERPTDSGTVVTKTTLEIPAYGIHLESFGGNDNGGADSKNFDLGDAYKGSVTDAITKICSYLEIGLDVFKGKSTPKDKETLTSQAKIRSVRTIPGQAAEAPQNTESDQIITPLPALTPDNKSWATVVKRLQGGVTMDIIQTHFTISPADKRRLVKEANAK